MPIRFKFSKLWTNLEKLCTLRKTNICSCHLAFFTICIYRGAMGLLLTGHRGGGERPGLSRLARPRPRPRLRQAKTPNHRGDKAKDAHRPRPRPSLPCLLASATKNAAHSPGRDQNLPDELSDPKNYACPEKPMSVPVTWHFLQYVYIGEPWVCFSPAPDRGMSDQGCRGLQGQGQGQGKPRRPAIA